MSRQTGRQLSQYTHTLYTHNIKYDCILICQRGAGERLNRAVQDEHPDGQQAPVAPLTGRLRLAPGLSAEC